MSKDIFDKKRNFLDKIWDFKESDFGRYVYTFMNTAGDMSKTLGRVVQVRVKAGLAGSDRVLLRHPDGILMCHENQAFFRITDKREITKLDKMYSSICDDGIDIEYTDCKKIPATGFIVKGLPESDEALVFSMMSDGNKTIIQV